MNDLTPEEKRVILDKGTKAPHLTEDVQGILIPKVIIKYKKWQREPIADTWGGKALIDYDDRPMFAELAIMHDMMKEGWQARWLETYSMKNGVPYFFSSWTGRPLKQNADDLIQDQGVMSLLDKIAQKNGGYYGAWDVVAWRGDEVLMIESKRSKADKLRDTQIAWLKSWLEAGLTVENFMIVEWDFEDEV